MLNKKKGRCHKVAAFFASGKQNKIGSGSRNLPEALKGVYEGLGMKDKAEEIGKFIEANAK